MKRIGGGEDLVGEAVVSEVACRPSEAAALSGARGATFSQGLGPAREALADLSAPPSAWAVLRKQESLQAWP